EDRVETMLFPRVAAIAETAWSPGAARGWDGFADRVPAMLGRYKALGVKADDAAVAVQAKLSPAADSKGEVALLTQFGLGEIRYTTDGSAPKATSALYAAPLALPLPTRLKAAAFKDGKAISPVTQQVIDALTIRHKTGQQLDLCTNK